MSHSGVQRAIEKATKISPSNWIDRAVSYFDPVRGAQRVRARLQTQGMMALSGGYTGASKTRRSLMSWLTGKGDADAEILPDLPDMRDRCRDLVRNTPLASGALNTKCTSVVGTGLRLQSRVDREYVKARLGWTDEQLDEWETNVEREWKLWADTNDCDAEAGQTFGGLQDLVFRSRLEAGDVLATMPLVDRSDNKYQPYSLAVQIIEGDRLCNESNARDTATLAGGVEKNQHGAPETYHILKGHPGNLYSKKNEWMKIPARGRKSGRRNVLHLMKKKRPGQTRGVPDFAPVIEAFKQISTYTEAEIDAAVISSFFTVFIKTEDGDSGVVDPTGIGEETGSSSSDKDFKMGKGAILDLADGESVETANPGRPNTAFDPFVRAVLRQIGTALELPFEILVKHFTASFSAAQAALLEAWKYYRVERQWVGDQFCQPIFEEWLNQAVLLGRVNAPGFLSDPALHAAWCGSEWIGPARGAIDQKKEAEGLEKMIELGLKTRSEATAEMTGGDYETKHRQQVKEESMRRDAGFPALGDEKAPAAAAPAEPEPPENLNNDLEKPGDE